MPDTSHSSDVARSWVGLLDEAGGDFYRFNCFDLEAQVAYLFTPHMVTHPETASQASDSANHVQNSWGMMLRSCLRKATADPRLMQQSPDGRLDHVVACLKECHLLAASYLGGRHEGDVRYMESHS